MIDAEKANFEVARMARLNEVSRSGFYAWKKRGSQPGPRARRRADLASKIVAFHADSDGVNGAPRILADLRDSGEVVSRKTVAKIMRTEGIAGISPATWRPVTTIVGDGHTIPDLVGRRFDQGALNRVWTSDITYLATGQGWLYLLVTWNLRKVWMITYRHRYHELRGPVDHVGVGGEVAGLGSVRERWAV
ncbi:MAG: IS3 family transposase, partial [Candidatus Nanopelagicales bacterium]|nr:IS3 family transposase [Candidatus Nanopelagicales bacterium]